MLDCVIFDLDGLLVDSEPLQFRSYQKAFAQNGHQITKNDWQRWLEVSVAVPAWIQLDDLRLDPEKIRADKKVIYDKMIQQELAIKPGADKLIKELSNHTRLCVASGSRIESIKLCLEKFNLDQYFEAFYSGAFVKRSKPYPDVYFYALEKMMVKPEHVIAIEDSPQGLKAASAAGIKCVVCPDKSNPVSKHRYVGAEMFVDSLDQLNFEQLTKITSN